MCLGVFIGSVAEIPLFESSEISIQELGEAEQPVLRLFSLPHVRYLGAHTGCSCGFPHVVAEVPVEWYQGFFDDDDQAERQKNVASVERLFALIQEQLKVSNDVEIFPVWNGEETSESKGTIELALSELVPERFFFNERFLHRIHK